MADVENDNNNKSASLTFVKFMFFAQGLCLSFGQSDPPYVAVVRNSVATKNTFTVIEVYRGTGDVEFDKAKYLVAEEALKFDDNLPKESVINTTMEPATLLLPATLTPADRSGIYTITVTRNGESETIWRALVTNEDATTRAVEYSTVASRGDAVTVTVETDITPQTDIRWRRDGLLNPLNGGERCLLSCGDDNATAGSNVVFECFRVGRYLSQMHAIMNVVVRECEHNKWGPPGCMNDCQPCINGGICSDLTGWCLCPPGFSGYHCENVHGSNVFGQNAEYRCDDSSDDHSNGCQGALICYPNPFGCTCPAGYTGFDCMETCERGKFGANCKQECHCKDQCASDTGVCEDGECEDGWYGVNCQLTEMPVDCRPGLYGDFCSNPCSCETEDCSDVEANCAAGCAVPWTGSACNQNTGDGIINLSYDKVNAGQVTAMRCSVIRNPPISEGDLILSLAGTPCTDCDNQNSDRSYNLTRTVMLPLSTSVEVTCSVRNTNLMETTMLVPFVLPAYASSDVLTFHDVTSTSITVRWSPWNDMNDFGDGPVIDYRIQIRENGTEVFSNESKETDLVHQFLDLTPDTLYEFRIILVREGQGGEGAPSNVQRQRTLCDDFPVVIVAVVVAVVVVLTLLCLGGLICRRRSSKPQTVQKYPELGEKVVNPAYNNASSSSEEKLSETNEEEKPSYISEHDETSSQQPVSSHVIKISDLAAYVREKKGNSEDNFSTEFETLPTDPLYPWTVGEKPENKMKNRYGNIVPYDNSRVVLEIVEGDPHSDYINASYIDGYKSPKKFIASHGPNQASVIDFWRMVWQEDVARIVMLTPLFEGEKPKCLEYWPEEEKVFGELFVRCHKLEKHSKYSQRTFYVTLKHGSESKLVEHFHFTNWKDMKVPEFLDPTLEFLRIVRKDYSGRGGCTIVHCSAGAGRTGTYITLDAMLDMGQAEQQINVYEFVQQMRHTRFQSVQVKGQYEFIFDTLVKHFCIGRTSMSVESFRSDLSGLQQVNSATGNTFIMDQYKKLEETTRVAASSEVLEGKKEENKDKNRSSNMLPVETHRPILMTQIKDDESNYINATFLDGYKQRYFFIATQMPLEKTIVDFWRLLWDYNCSVIVMLNSLENKNEQYWPDSSPVTFAPFTVVPLSSDYHGNICVRKVEVRNATLQKKRTIHQMQCIIDRPNQEFAATESSETLINCTHLLKKFCSESKVNRVLVHCIDGVGWTGVFCALVAALDQARTEQEVDIFQHVANMRKAQPLMIQNFEQYQCIFDFVLSDLESDGNAYQNV